MLSEKRIEKIRVTVEDLNKTNLFYNIEATLNLDSQESVVNQAEDVVKYSTMERPAVAR